MNLNEARNLVFDKKPLFKAFFDLYRDNKWSEYRPLNTSKCSAKKQHFEELVTAFEQSISPLLGREKVEAATETLRSTGFVSTADHSGVLCHPFFSNSAVVRSQNSAGSIISFTCGGVSLTNSSYPRGIFFHDTRLNVQKISLVSLKGRRRSVYGLQGFKKEKIISIIDSIKNFDIADKQKEKLQSFFGKILKNEKIFDCKRYSDQLTIVNDIFWDEIFEKRVGNLVYVEAEKIVSQLLLNVHLSQKTLINKVIFDQDVRENFVRNFEKIVGAHDTASKSGSHLFWYLNDEKNCRVQLFLEENSLVSLDKKIKIDLNEKILREHLKNYTLLPSMAFCYAVLAGFYGLTLGGGFSQIKYLGDILYAWTKTAQFARELSENPPSNIFSGEFVLLGITDGKKAAPASLFDAFLYGNSPLNSVSEAINGVSVGDSIDAMMDEFVEIVSGTKPAIEDVKIHPTFHV